MRKPRKPGMAEVYVVAFTTFAALLGGFYYVDATAQDFGELVRLLIPIGAGVIVLALGVVYIAVATSRYKKRAIPETQTVEPMPETETAENTGPFDIAAEYPELKEDIHPGETPGWACTACLADNKHVTICDYCGVPKPA